MVLLALALIWALPGAVSCWLLNAASAVAWIMRSISARVRGDGVRTAVAIIGLACTAATGKGAAAGIGVGSGSADAATALVAVADVASGVATTEAVGAASPVSLNSWPRSLHEYLWPTKEDELARKDSLARMHA